MRACVCVYNDGLNEPELEVSDCVYIWQALPQADTE